MRDTSWQHDDVSGSKFNRRTTIATELNRDGALCDSKDFMRGCVEMMVWKQSIAPGSIPSVREEQPLNFRWAICRCERDRAAIEDHLEARIWEFSRIVYGKRFETVMAGAVRLLWG